MPNVAPRWFGGAAAATAADSDGLNNPWPTVSNASAGARPAQPRSPNPTAKPADEHGDADLGGDQLALAADHPFDEHPLDDGEHDADRGEHQTRAALLEPHPTAGEQTEGRFEPGEPEPGQQAGEHDRAEHACGWSASSTALTTPACGRALRPLKLPLRSTGYVRFRSGLGDAPPGGERR